MDVSVMKIWHIYIKKTLATIGLTSIALGFQLLFNVGTVIAADTSMFSSRVSVSDFTVSSSSYILAKEVTFNTTINNEDVFLKTSYNVEMSTGVGLQQLYMRAVFDEGTPAEKVVIDKKVRSTRVLGSVGAVAAPIVDTTLANSGTHKLSLYFRRDGNGNLNVKNLDAVIAKVKNELLQPLQLHEVDSTFTIASGTFTQVGNITFNKTNAGPIVHSFPHSISATSVNPTVYNTDGLVGLWRFNDGTATDTSGANHHGTVSGATYEAVGGFNGRGAFSFDGSNDYIALNQVYSGNGTLPTLTACGWFKIPSDGGGWAILDFDRSELFNFEIGSTNRSTKKLRFATKAPSGGIHDMQGERVVNDNKWHHACAVYDGSDKVIYVDGVEDARVVNPHSGQALGRGTRYGFIGDGSEATTFDGRRNKYYYKGKLDDVAMWERGLPANEIAAIYDSAFIKYEMYAEDTNSGQKSSRIARSVALGGTGSVADVWTDVSNQSNVNLNVYARALNGTALVSGTLSSIGMADGSGNIIPTFSTGSSDTNLVNSKTFGPGTHKLGMHTHTMKHGSQMWMSASISLESNSNQSILPKVSIRDDAKSDCSVKQRTLSAKGEIGSIELNCIQDGYAVGDTPTFEIYLEVPPNASVKVIDEQLVGVESTPYDITEISTKPLISITNILNDQYLQSNGAQAVNWNAVDQEDNDFVTNVKLNGVVVEANIPKGTTSTAIDTTTLAEGGPYTLEVEVCETSPMTHCRTDSVQFYVDNTAPTIKVVAPTKITTDDAISDTIITITDNLKVDVATLDFTASTAQNIENCRQETDTRIVCEMIISESGDVSVSLQDASGNTASVTEKNYLLLPPGSCTDTPPTIIPQITAIDVLDTTRMNVKFTNLTGTFTGYEIVYGVNSANLTRAIGGIGSSAEEQYVTGLQSNTKYYYKIRAVNGCAKGPLSTVRAAMTRPLEYPLNNTTNPLYIREKQIVYVPVQPEKTTPEEESSDSKAANKEDTKQQGKTNIVNHSSTGLRFRILVKNQDGVPLKRARVHFVDSDVIDYTDEKGVVEFNKMSKGVYAFSVDYGGKTVKDSIDVERSGQYTFNIDEKTDNVWLSSWPYLGILLLFSALLNVYFVRKLRST